MVFAYHKHKILHRRPRQKCRGAKARLRAALARLPAPLKIKISFMAGLTPATHEEKLLLPKIGFILFTAGLLLGGCDPVQIIEGSDTHVSVRYDGMMNGLDKATELAQHACAQHGKTAKLRRTYYEGLGAGERFAFFDCV
jgi:hypothetical protein